MAVARVPSVDAFGERITVSIKKLTEITGLAPTTIYKLINTEELESFTYGSKRLIVVDSYRRFIERGRQAEVDRRAALGTNKPPLRKCQLASLRSRRAKRQAREAETAAE
jgi:hypothetical protein